MFIISNSILKKLVVLPRLHSAIAEALRAVAFTSQNNSVAASKALGSECLHIPGNLCSNALTLVLPVRLLLALLNFPLFVGSVGQDNARSRYGQHE